ncbi:hypothetical protein [Millionella massiliensis]|uniref:hypothetical protein n=1 Tax=Millionella massiliensis TaxID=1871023 RepID=UPI0023A7C7EF|nr:hypothetical protein [Millionella massiliensis]
MRQTIFTTRQRAEEILKEAVAIWEHSVNGEHLEGVEQDPVFSLLMTALAYQANEIDNEIEQLRTDVLDEFARMLIPYERTHALPATALVEVAPDEQVPELVLDQHTRFTLSDSSYTFIPMLRTRVLNAAVASVVRLDNRRWKVTLQCKEPVANLSGVTFRIGNNHFQDLKLFVNGHPLPLIKPWDYADLPLSGCFSLENRIYNSSSLFQPSHIWFDLFARQNVRLFAVDSYKTPQGQSYPSEKVELVFEFVGIDDNFLFDKEQLSLNCTLLVNAVVRTATLSSQSPLARLTGESGDLEKWQFLHLVRPPDMQLFRDEPLELRHVAADRFEADRLVKLATTLISRFSSDYYAFQGIESLREGSFMEQFYALLKRMSEGIAKTAPQKGPGLYLMLRNVHGFHPKEVSLNVDYLMTNGSAVNALLSGKSQFVASSVSHVRSARLLADPMPGFDELQSLDAQNTLARYYLITNDRIVTPADIKVLCYNELAGRFGIMNDMVERIKVRQVQHAERNHCGFETQVFITLKDNPFIKRSFQDKIPMTELTLQKMIEVRSTNVFPVQVTIEIV